MHKLPVVIFLLAFTTLNAQKKEEGFDASFRSTKNTPRYYVSTELKDGRWYREGWFLPERTMAMYGWYKDEECKTADGEVAWFYTNKNLLSMGKYVNGWKQGSWVSFHENGMLRDSSVYESGIRTGIGLTWDKEGYMVDSINLDKNGNGVEVAWYGGGVGTVSMTGFRERDTMLVKKWSYFHRNGKLKATVMFKNNEESDCHCFDDTGKELEQELCKGQEANFKGKEEGWRKYLERNLDGAAPIKKGAPTGIYTVMVQFVVGTEGEILDIQPLTKFGFGMEDEVVRLMKKSPKWIPARQYGKNVLAYRKQPVTFQIF